MGYYPLAVKRFSYVAETQEGAGDNDFKDL